MKFHDIMVPLQNVYYICADQQFYLLNRIRIQHIYVMKENSACMLKLRLIPSKLQV